MSFQPKRPRNRDRINSGLRPPCRLATGPMELAMMASAKGYRELIADLASERRSLHESEMMRIRRTAATNHTGLSGDEFDVKLVT
jgi:hypothetical protein